MYTLQPSGGSPRGLPAGSYWKVSVGSVLKSKCMLSRFKNGLPLSCENLNHVFHSWRASGSRESCLQISLAWWSLAHMCVCSNFNVKHTLLHVQASYFVRAHVTFDRSDVGPHGKKVIHYRLNGQNSKKFSLVCKITILRARAHALLYSRLSAHLHQVQTARWRAPIKTS